MKRLHTLSLLLLFITSLTACTTVDMKPLEKPAAGYKAVKFQQFTTLNDHSINVYAFAAGAILINDREMDGVPFYCGPHTINNTAFESCFAFKGNTIIIGYGSFKEVQHDLTGKIAHIRVNP